MSDRPSKTGRLIWLTRPQQHLCEITYQSDPKVSERPSKTGRQLQSVAKQFGSIGKTVSADSDENETIADDDDDQ